MSPAIKGSYNNEGILKYWQEILHVEAPQLDLFFNTRTAAEGFSQVKGDIKHPQLWEYQTQKVQTFDARNGSEKRAETSLLIKVKSGKI